jgi:predicted amidohydrolase YtcJ
MSAAEAQLYFGGEVYTLEESRPSAEAVAVRDGRILAVGGESECRAALGRDPVEIDLQGRVLLPGFIDTHLHPVMMAYFEMNADLAGVASIGELQDRLRRAAEESSDGEWLVGLRFGDEAMKELRLPTRRDLDTACGDRPVLVLRHDGHMVIGNTRAIEAAGITRATHAPAGGQIDREADGTPAGPFRENAVTLLLNAMPAPDLEQLRSGARAAFARLTRSGVTSAGIILQTDEEGPAGEAGALEVAGMQVLLPETPFSTYALLIGADVEKVVAARETPLHDPQAGRRVGGVKIFADGTLGSCTALMGAPFSDQPERQGFMTTEEDEIYRRMVEAHRRGLQIGVHAIGDEANRRCLGLYERLLAEHPRADHRHRIEHASVLDGESIARMARLGVVVSTQPLFIHSEKTWLHKRLGPDRARQTYPLRSLLEAGVRVAGASDAPVESTDVLHALQCCVTREGFEVEQGISAAQALRMFTIDAAYAQFEDHEKGSILPGKRADFTVLSANPVSVPAEAIRAIRVEQTIVEGRPVYTRGV